MPYDEKVGKWIIAYERPSILILAPIICLFTLLMSAFGENMPRLREIPFKDIIITEIKNKIEEGKRLHKEWKMSEKK